MSTFIISDTHFGHAATFERFKRDDGSPLRPFTSVDEMNDTMIKNWNDVVKDDDLVIHLGDVVMSHRYLPIMNQLNGRKELVAGNHDPIGGKRGKKFPFDQYFARVMAMKVFDDMVLTHIPIHPSNIGRWGTNVHGHLHGGQVMREVYDSLAGSTFSHEMKDEPDPRYLCVSVEHTDYKPISLDEVRKRIADRRIQYNYTPPRDPFGNGSDM